MKNFNEADKALRAVGLQGGAYTGLTMDGVEENGYIYEGLDSDGFRIEVQFDVLREKVYVEHQGQEFNESNLEKDVADAIVLMAQELCFEDY